MKKWLLDVDMPREERRYLSDKISLWGKYSDSNMVSSIVLRSDLKEELYVKIFSLVCSVFII